jgi:hypothetical protein
VSASRFGESVGEITRFVKMNGTCCDKEAIRSIHVPTNERTNDRRKIRLLTAVRIGYVVICDVDSASVELTFGRYVRNAWGDLGPHGLTGRVAGEQRRRLPYRRERVDGRRHGRIRVHCALGIGVCVGKPKYEYELYEILSEESVYLCGWGDKIN